MRLTIDLNQTGILGKHVLLALSGGADSVALFYLLYHLQREGKIRLTNAHFEHGIRSEASLRDRDFVKALSDEYEVPLVSGSGNVPEEAKKTGEGLETCARRMRYAFLKEAMGSVGADVIALAHHRNDQAETVLMHLLRGGGMKGAVGMRMADGLMVRPLLMYTKDDIISFLKETGASWCEDETNRESDNPRNFLRNRVLPEIQKAYPGADRALARFSCIVQAEDAYMRRMTAQAYREHVSYYASVCIISRRKEIDTAILRRLICMTLSNPDFDDVERVRLSTGKTNLSGDAYAYGYENEIYIAWKCDSPQEIPLPDEGCASLDGICRIEVQNAPPIPVKDNGLIQVLNACCLTGAVVRTRREGDYMHPFGMNGKSKLLSDILTDKKVPRPIRDAVPVIARGSEVLWAAGVGISENAKVANGCDARRIQIRIENNGGETNVE